METKVKGNIGRPRKRKPEMLNIHKSTALMPAQTIRNVESDDLGPPVLEPMVNVSSDRTEMDFSTSLLLQRQKKNASQKKKLKIALFPKKVSTKLPIKTVRQRKRKHENTDSAFDKNKFNNNAKRAKTTAAQTSVNTFYSEPPNLEIENKTNMTAESIVIKKEPVVVLQNLNLPVHCRVRVRSSPPDLSEESTSITKPNKKSNESNTASSILPDKPSVSDVPSPNTVFVAADERIDSVPPPINDHNENSISASVVCRTCGVAGSERFSIVGFKAERLNLLHHLKTYLNIEILDCQKLPLNICQMCSQTILVFHKFHNRVLATTNRLTAVLNENTDEKDSWHKVPWYGDNILAMATASTEFLSKKHNREKAMTQDESKPSTSNKFITTNIEKIFGDKNNGHLVPDLAVDENSNSNSENDVEPINTDNYNKSNKNTAVSNENKNQTNINLVNIDGIASKNKKITNGNSVVTKNSKVLKPMLTNKTTTSSNNVTASNEKILKIPITSKIATSTLTRTSKITSSVPSVVSSTGTKNPQAQIINTKSITSDKNDGTKTGKSANNRESANDIEFVSTNNLFNENSKIPILNIDSGANSNSHRPNVKLVNIEDIACKNRNIISSTTPNQPTTKSPALTMPKLTQINKVSTNVTKSVTNTMPILTTTNLNNLTTGSGDMPILIPLNNNDSQNQVLLPNSTVASGPFLLNIIDQLKPFITKNNPKIQSVILSKNATLIPSSSQTAPFSNTPNILKKSNNRILVAKSPSVPTKQVVSTSLSSGQTQNLNKPTVINKTSPFPWPNNKKVSVIGKVTASQMDKTTKTNTVPIKPKSILTSSSLASSQEDHSNTFLVEKNSESGLSILTPVSREKLNKLISSSNKTQLIKIPNINSLVSQPIPVTLPQFISTGITTIPKNTAKITLPLTPTTTINLTEKTVTPNNKVSKISNVSPISTKTFESSTVEKEIDWSKEETNFLKEIHRPSRDDKYTYVVKMDRKDNEQPYYVLSPSPLKLNVPEFTLYNIGIIAKDVYKAEMAKKKNDRGEFLKIGSNSWAHHIVWLWQFKFKGDVKSYVKQSADKVFEFGNRIKNYYERRCNWQSQKVVNKCLRTYKSSPNIVSTGTASTSNTVLSVTKSHPTIFTSTSTSTSTSSQNSTSATPPVIFIDPKITNQSPSLVTSKKSTNTPVQISTTNQQPLYLIPLSAPINTAFTGLSTVNATKNVVLTPTTSTNIISSTKINNAQQNKLQQQKVQAKSIELDSVHDDEEISTTTELSSNPKQRDDNTDKIGTEKSVIEKSKEENSTTKVQISYTDSEDIFDIECVSDDDDDPLAIKPSQTNDDTKITKESDNQPEKQNKSLISSTEPNDKDKWEKIHVESVIWNELDTQMVVEID